MHHNPHTPRNRRRLRPHQLRDVCGGPVYNNKRHRPTIFTSQASVYGTANQSTPQPSDSIFHNLRLFGDVPVLRESVGGGCCGRFYFMWNTRLYGDNRLEEKTEMVESSV